MRHGFFDKDFRKNYLTKQYDRNNGGHRPCLSDF